MFGSFSSIVRRWSTRIHHSMTFRDLRFSNTNRGGSYRRLRFRAHGRSDEGGIRGKFNRTKAPSSSACIPIEVEDEPPEADGQ